MLGIIPAAGTASRLQPLAGAKELLPLGRSGGQLRVVSEYLLDRMLLAGADRICFVISPEKQDLIRFYSRSEYGGRFFYVCQPQAGGLCDAVFRAAPHVQDDEAVLIGLPDTVWHPRTAFANAPCAGVHLITFPVGNPADFDAVIATGEPRSHRVSRVEVKKRAASGDPDRDERRVWGAITMSGHVFADLEQFWNRRGAREVFLGDLFNQWIAAGNVVTYDEQGSEYWDIGTVDGYERALRQRAWLPSMRQAVEPSPSLGHAFDNGGWRPGAGGHDDLGVLEAAPANPNHP
ncbi:MAG TPA: sugar phosphate nucleotidyltransferase [Terriglobales bacterium]|nr:sugar phosphate nucleotidyltransferase [Terriglobales bacterium]